MALLELFAADRATTAVTSGGSAAPASGTPETWTVASSAMFGAASTGVSQFHVADPAAPSEIIAVTDVSGTTWTVTRGADSTTPVTHAAGFTIYQTATAGWLGGLAQLAGPAFTGTPTAPTAAPLTASTLLATTAYADSAVAVEKARAEAGEAAAQAAAEAASIPLQPWQFFPETYGALGNGKVIGDAVISGGSLSTLTSATAGFASGDTGKYIMINGGQGNNAQPLITTITYLSATTVTLAAPATGAVADGSAVYGTDDTAAVRACVAAAGTYATGADYHVQVIFGSKIYCLATPPAVMSGVAGSTTCQVPLPRPAANGTTQKLVIDLLGTGAADNTMYWEAAVPQVQGTCLVSMCIPPYSPGTNPYPSVVGFEYADTGGLAGGYANTKVYVDGICAVIPYLGPQGAWDFRFLGGAGGGRFSALAFGAPEAGYNQLGNLNNLSGQQNGSSVALFMPLTGNNDDCTIASFADQGFTFGVNVTEHCAFQRLASVYDIVGIQCVGGGAHGNWIGYASVEACYAAVQYTGTAAFPLVIDLLDCETITAYHLQDTQDALYGSVTVHTNSGAPGVLGCVNLKITWDGLGPGAWAGAPAVPATATLQRNTAYRDATVYITSGGAAVSAVKVDSTVTGLTLGTTGTAAARVPAGHTITLTYASAAPTWVWVLD
jgi:hypothetical protein